MEFSLVNLLLVLLVAWIAGALAQRIGYPAILGELAAGVILGPALLGWLYGSPGLKVLAEVGVFLMMLYIGMEVDHRDLMKASWAGLWAAVGGLVVPFAAGFYYTRNHGFSLEAALFLGLAMGVTALATNPRILVDLKLLGTRVGQVLIAGALITDTVCLVLFTAVLKFAEGTGLGWSDLVPVAAKLVLFFGITIVVGIRFFPRIGGVMNWLGFTERTANFTLVLLIGLVFAQLAEFSGLHFILGAFLAGLFIREGVLKRQLSHEISSLVHDLSIGFLAPIFFVTAGFSVSFEVFRTDLHLLIAVMVLATVTKILGVTLFYLPTRNGLVEGLTIGAGMNGRGAVEVIIAQIALEMGVIDIRVFSILVFMAFFTTATVPFFLKWGTDWLRRRGRLVRLDEHRQGVLIVGALPLSRVLAKELAFSGPVFLVDSNIGRCRAARAEGLNVVHGNALQEQTLDIANADTTRDFLAMTSNPEVNTFAAALARDLFAIPNVHTINSTRETQSKVKSNNKDETPASPPLFGGPVAFQEWNRWIARREVDTTTILISQPTVVEELFKKLHDEQRMLPLLVVREGKRVLPNTVGHLHKGDEVIALRHLEKTDTLADRFDQIIKDCAIIDVDSSMTHAEFFDRAALVLADRLRMEASLLQKMLIEREKETSTVITRGMAIPHIIVEGKGIFNILIARCREGLKFPNSESEVTVVFVIVGSRDERNLHLRILSAIAQIVHDPSFEEKWMAAENTEQLRHVILSAERRRF